MRKFIHPIALSLALIITATPRLLSAADRLKLTPDFLQSDPEGRFKDGGAYYCGPVSVSNALVWLSHQGFDRLLPDAVSEKKAQIDLIRKLASDGYMNTDRNGKTMLPELIQGMQRLVNEAGYKIDRLEFQGLSTMPPALESCRRRFQVDLDWLVKRLDEPKTAVTAHIGWYEQKSGITEFHRTTGHHVTVVGLQGSTLIVHDPAFYAGTQPASDRIALTPFPSGKLISNHTREPVESSGYYQAQVAKMPDPSVFCLLESVLVFDLK